MLLAGSSVILFTLGILAAVADDIERRDARRRNGR
jgi:hypothetical protein